MAGQGTPYYHTHSLSYGLVTVTVKVELVCFFQTGMEATYKGARGAGKRGSNLGSGPRKRKSETSDALTGEPSTTMAPAWLPMAPNHKWAQPRALRQFVVVNVKNGIHLKFNIHTSS